MGRVFKSTGSQKSKTGETEYLGSKKSDRFARVYRYDPPHERSDKMRIEMVFKRDQAEQAYAAIQEHGIWRAALMSGNVYKFEHPDWTTLEGYDMDMEKMKYAPNEQRGQSTVMWLLTQVKPAIERAHREGLIDKKRFVLEHFLGADPDTMLDKKK